MKKDKTMKQIRVGSKTYRVKEEQHRQLRIEAAKRGTTVPKLFTEALTDWLEKND